MDIKNLSQKELDELIARAEKRKRELSQERVIDLREKIEAMLAAENLTLEEVFAAGRRTRGASRTKGMAVKAKYRNPDDPSQTWAGRGKRPRWFADALAGGRDEKDFLID